MTKGSKTVDGKATKAETAAWVRFSRQAYQPLISQAERIEDAFRAGYRIARDIEVKKAEKLAAKGKK